MAKKQVVKAPVKKESAAEKLRKLDDATMKNNIEDLKKELFNLRLQAAVGKLENTAKIGKIKKEIARMMTILNERANAAK